MKKTVLFKILKVLLNSFIAGIIFGLCCIAMSFDSFIFGGIVLSVGFILCMLYAYDSYLIRVPYVLENNALYIIDTLVSLVGNIFGTIVVALLLNLTGFHDSNTYVTAIKALAINFNHFEVLLYAFISGVFIYFGVNTYKKAEQPIARFLVIIACISASAAFGMCQINIISFLFCTNGFSADLFGKFFTVLLGNTLGLLLIPALRKLRSKLS